MAEYKITIDINNNGQGGNSEEISGGGKSSKSSLSLSSKTARNAAIALGAGKRLLQYGLSSVEMYTGSSTLQTKVDNTMQAVNYGIGLITNPIATLATMGVNAVTQALTRSNEIMWGNKQAERLQRRGGIYLSANQR